MLQLALIGVGKWGQNYLKTVNDIPNCQIKYIKTRDYSELLNEQALDGIIIATPGSTHFTIASQFLQKGFNLLIEKPLTTNIEEAEELLTIWREKKPHVLVGHTYLYNQNYLQIKLRLPEIGQVERIEFEGLSSPIRNDLSVLWDWGPHAVSLFLDLMQESVIKVTSDYKTNEASLQLYFESGVIAKARMSWIYPQKVRKLRIFGNKKTLEVDFTQPVPEQPLILQVKEFVNAVENNNPIISNIKFGVEVVRILSLAEQYTS